MVELRRCLGRGDRCPGGFCSQGLLSLGFGSFNLLTYVIAEVAEKETRRNGGGGLHGFQDYMDANKKNHKATSHISM